MLESVLFPAVIGSAWGLAVSVFNRFLAWYALSRPKGMLSTLIFVIRQLLLVGAMAMVYRNVVMLIGTALGLLAIKNYIFVKNMYVLFRERKG